jgi:hypothetical protein
MTRFLFPCAFLLLFLTPSREVSSQEVELDKSFIFLTLGIYVDTRTFMKPEGKVRMRELAAALSPEEIDLFLDLHHSEHPARKAALNFFLPGLGSFRQADNLGGGISLLLGGNVLAAGYIVFLTNVFAEPGGVRPSGGDYFLISLVAHGLFAVIRPIAWAAKWNRHLDEALGVSAGGGPAPSAEFPGVGWRVELSLASLSF